MIPENIVQHGGGNPEWEDYFLHLHLMEDGRTHMDLRLACGDMAEGFTIIEHNQFGTHPVNVMAKTPKNLNNLHMNTMLSDNEGLILLSTGKYRIHNASYERAILHFQPCRSQVDAAPFTSAPFSNQIPERMIDLHGYWMIEAAGKESTISRIPPHQSRHYRRQWVNTISKTSVIHKPEIQRLDSIFSLTTNPMLNTIARETNLSVKTVRKYGRLLGYL